MPLFETFDQTISAFIIWLLGFFFLEYIRKKFHLGFKVTHILYIWHTLFSLIYAIYTQTHIADATVYYQRALTEVIPWGIGTKFIINFSSIFTNAFNLSYFGTYLIYNIIGTTGIIAFYASLKVCIAEKGLLTQRLSLIVIFLPSLHFWSAGLGKEPFALLSTGLALWAVLNIKRRIWLLVLAICIMGIIRPHVAGIFIVALSIAIMTDKNISLTPRIILFLISILLITVGVPYIVEFTGLGNLNNSLEFIETRQSYNQSGGGGINISTMSLPMQLFTYLFRPLPFEAHSAGALLSSIDNSFLIILSCLFLYGLSKSKNRKAAFRKKYNLVFISAFIAITWGILAITTANLGIAVRQKWMFLPFVIFIFFLYIPNIKAKTK